MLRDSRVWYDVVRPGLLLYGIVPPPLASTIPLTPVMSLTSRVVAVKGLRPGEGVGYGWRYQADEPRTVAVVPAGYADGLDTRVCGRGHVLIRGRRVPIVGAVSMDMITVDVTDLEDVPPGDEVVLLGRQGTRAGSRSTRARWRRQSARFRGKSSAASAHESNDSMSKSQVPKYSYLKLPMSSGLGFGSWDLGFGS